jgi:hypothetical protein
MDPQVTEDESAISHALALLALLAGGVLLAEFHCGNLTRDMSLTRDFCRHAGEMAYHITMAYIYALCHPMNVRPYYVGQTTNTPEQRLSGHVKWRPGASPSRVTRWAHICNREGWRPSVCILEVVWNATNEEVNARERWWIAHYTRKYPGLLNEVSRPALVAAIARMRDARKSY